MTKETAEAIREAGETMFACEVRSDFSAYGMFGETTHAVVIPSYSHFCTALAYAVIESRNSLDIAEETRKFEYGMHGDGIIIY